MKPIEDKAESQIPWDTSKGRTYYANVFHAASGREEVVLLFGQHVPAPRDQSEERLEFKERIVLNPFVAKRFAVQLQNALRTYELTYGPLDKEPFAIEPTTSLEKSGITDKRAHQLLRLVGKLEVE